MQLLTLMCTCISSGLGMISDGIVSGILHVDSSKSFIVAFFTFCLWATSMFSNRFIHVAPPPTIRLLQHQFALMWCPSTYPLRSKKACLLSKLFFFCKKTFMFHFSFELSFSKNACLMISWLLITMPYISFFAIKIEKHQTLVHRNLILFGLGHGLSRKLSRTHTHRTSTGREHHRGCAQGGTNSWEL